MERVNVTTLDSVRIEVIGEGWAVTIPASRIVQMFEVAKELSNMDLDDTATRVKTVLSVAPDAELLRSALQELEPVLKLAIALRDGKDVSQP